MDSGKGHFFMSLAWWQALRVVSYRPRRKLGGARKDFFGRGLPAKEGNLLRRKEVHDLTQLALWQLPPSYTRTCIIEDFKDFYFITTPHISHLHHLCNWPLKNYPRTRSHIWKSLVGGRPSAARNRVSDLISSLC